MKQLLTTLLIITCLTFTALPQTATPTPIATVEVDCKKEPELCIKS